MRNGMKERIIGGAILVALAIIVVPMFFGGSGKKDGSSQAPNMTINEEQIDVPDDQQQVSNGDANEGQQQGEGAGSDVSQYSQLLPGSEGPKDIHPDAQAAVNQAQQGSDSNSAAGGDEGSSADQQAHQMERSQPVHESTAQQHTQPAPAPQRPEHREPAKSEAAPSKPAPSKPAAKPQQTSGNSDHAIASNTQPKSTSQQRSGSSMSSSDPILAAANRYDANRGSASVSRSGNAAASSASASGASASGRWSVQAGSFGNAANADNLVKRLKGLGFNAYQISRGANKVVLVGPYNSSGAGESARTQLQQKANINGFVVHSGGNAG